MNAFRFDGVFSDQDIFALNVGFFFEGLFLQFGDFGADVGHHEEVAVVFARNEVDTFVGEFDGVVFFVDHKEKVDVDFLHVFALLGHVEILGFLQMHFHARF